MHEITDHAELKMKMTLYCFGADKKLIENDNDLFLTPFCPKHRARGMAYVIIWIEEELTLLDDENVLCHFMSINSTLDMH